jgi:peptide/nickel transport system substrate-binding protein
VNRNRLLLIIVVAIAVSALLITGSFFVWRRILTGPDAVITPVLAATPDPASTPTAPVVAASGSYTFVQAVGMAPLTFNPIFAADPAAQTMIDKLYPRLVGQDPNGGFIVPSALAQHWEISPDGRTYTFTLRDGIRWSDGEPVTAADFKFTYDALAAPSVQSPYRDRTAGIVQIDTPDPQTVVVTLAAPNCAELHSLRQPLLPSHKYAADFSDLAVNPLNQIPQVSAGPFVYAGQEEGGKVLLARNPDYWQGAPQIQHWEVQVIPDPNARRQALADGTIDLAYFDSDEVVAMPLDSSSDAGSGAMVNYMATDGYSFLALNLADPANPQPGRASDGTSIPQTPHPILGDLVVRQAIAAAIDYDRIINEVYNGHARRIASYVPSAASWAYADDLPLPSYDPTLAAQRLTEAGWVDDDGDGVRSRAGQLLHLSIRTNEDNAQRVAMAHLIADELTAQGVQVDLQIVNFDELTSTLLDQRFDMVVIGWENLGADPANSPFWDSQGDVPGTGFNFTSFHDAEVDSWLESAARFPGCDLNSRSGFYKQVQQRIASQYPYIFLAAPESAWGYQSRWQGIAPGPWDIDYNVASWRLP